MMTRAAKLAVFTVLVLVASLCLQTWLLEGPRGLEHVHRDALRLLEALRITLTKGLKLMMAGLETLKTLPEPVDDVGAEDVAFESAGEE